MRKVLECVCGRERMLGLVCVWRGRVIGWSMWKMYVGRVEGRVVVVVGEEDVFGQGWG